MTRASTNASWTSLGRREVSGHSKWSSIKHKKGAADAKRGKLFSKLTRAIIVAAKEGGPDPAGNLALQNAVEKAKANSMPKDNIDRAIAKGTGTDSDSDAYETVVYEGYGPAGVAVIVESLTDNRNRTAGEVRHIFDKNDGNLGTSGSVTWLFERRGLVLVPADGTDEDELIRAAVADLGPVRDEPRHPVLRGEVVDCDEPLVVRRAPGPALEPDAGEIVSDDPVRVAADGNSVDPGVLVPAVAPEPPVSFWNSA